jgi:hypothetical protein
MYKIIRKWEREGNVPCCGRYLYQAEYVNGVKSDWMTPKEYREFKKKIIQETWK